MRKPEPNPRALALTKAALEWMEQAESRYPGLTTKEMLDAVLAFHIEILSVALEGSPDLAELPDILDDTRTAMEEGFAILERRFGLDRRRSGN